MPITIVTTPVNLPPADTLRRFISTTSTYLGLQDQRHSGAPGGSEFVDPPRFRHAFSAVTRRAAT